MSVPGLPVTVVLTRDGTEIARLLGGADWTSDSARAIVAYLTALPPPRSGPSDSRLSVGDNRAAGREERNP